MYIYGLNFYDGDYGLNQTVSEAVAAFKAVGDNIYAYEIGNEVDGRSSKGPTLHLAEYLERLARRL